MGSEVYNIPTGSTPARRHPLKTLSVYLPDSLEELEKKVSQSHQVTVDQFIASAVAEKLAAWGAEGYLGDRALKGTRERARGVLGKVGDKT